MWTLPAIHSQGPPSQGPVPDGSPGPALGATALPAHVSGVGRAPTQLPCVEVVGEVGLRRCG